MPNQRITGLNSEQFATLLTALKNHLTWNKPAEKPHKLTLTQALKMTLIYHRHNVTEELLASIFSVSQPTVSRTITSIEKALEKALRPLEQSIENSLKIPGSLVIDGTLIPTWNWRSLGKINFSGQHKRAGFNHQVICTVDGKLLAITDPVPGARHDAYAFKHHDLQKYLDESTLADKGYIGLGLASPGRRSKTRRIAADMKAVNRFINSRRAVVERVIAQVKTWRILHTGFSRPLGSYSRVFSSGAGVGVLCCWGGTFE